MHYLKRDDRSDLLLTTTISIMRNLGFAATTARRIAAESQSAVGNINRVFGSLQALKQQAFIAITHQVASDCCQRVSTLPPCDALLSLLGDPTEEAQDIQVHLWREVAVLAEQDDALQPVYREALDVWHRVLCEVIERGEAQGSLRSADSPSQTAWRLMASALGMDTLVRFSSLHSAAEQARAAMARLIALELFATAAA